MFRFERHLMKVDPETCSVHYILYLRFYKISLFKMLDLFPIVKGLCVSFVNGKFESVFYLYSVLFNWPKR